jgi:hypothetical protein
MARYASNTAATSSAPRACGSSVGVVRRWIRRERYPLPRGVGAADRLAQPTVASRGLAELLRELAEQALAGEIAARLRDLIAQDLGEAEVLEEGDDVGERLVEGERVAVRRQEILRQRRVEQRVRRLVRDDVVREAGEHEPARQLRAGRGAHRGEVAEQERVLARAVVRVRSAEGVRVDAEPVDELVPVADLARAIAMRPEHAPSERELEVAHRRHGDGVDELLVELRVSLVGIEPVGADVVLEVHRIVVRLARRIVVDDLDVLADRADAELLPRHAEGDLVHRRGLELLRESGIERIAAQAAPLREGCRGGTRDGAAGATRRNGHSRSGASGRSHAVVGSR